MINTEAPHITVESFWCMPEEGQHLELVRGEVLATPLPGAEHSVIVASFGVPLLQWAKATGTGVVSVRSGFILGRKPDTVRATDLAFVRADRLPAGRIPTGFFDLAPDLAVEVISPCETAADVQEKVLDYLDVGTRLVVLVYPIIRCLIAHAADGTGRTYREDEHFSAPTILPGFTCPVAEIFA
jgi:Uma2 family endonuclease